jgi:WD40 repeat protein
VDFSPDGKLLAVYSEAEAKLWDVTTGEHVYTFEMGLARFSPDGKILAVTRGDELNLWNTVTRKMLYTSPIGHTNRITAIAFMPDGQALLSASEDSTVKLWNTTPEQ